MNKHKAEQVAKYLQTENEAVNNHSLKIYNEIQKQGLIEDPSIILDLFQTHLKAFESNLENAILTTTQFVGAMQEAGLNLEQQIFLISKMELFMEEVEFEGDIDGVYEQLGVNKTRLSNELKAIQPPLPTNANLGKSLKEIVLHELQQFPKVLAQLSPKERIELVVKMMPYAFPKMDSHTFTWND